MLWVMMVVVLMVVKVLVVVMVVTIGMARMLILVMVVMLMRTQSSRTVAQHLDLNQVQICPLPSGMPTSKLPFFVSVFSSIKRG